MKKIEISTVHYDHIYETSQNKLNLTAWGVDFIGCDLDSPDIVTRYMIPWTNISVIQEIT